MLSNFDITALCKHYKLPLKGVFLRDQLPKRPLPGFYILNQDNSNTTDGTSYGTHWCACVCTQMECVYFDSFACIPPPEVNAWIKSVYANYGYNAWICQDLKAETCGFWCIGFGIHCYHHRLPGQSLADCANSYVNLFGEEKNERVLQEYFRKLGSMNHIVKAKLC